MFINVTAFQKFIFHLYNNIFIFITISGGIIKHAGICMASDLQPGHSSQKPAFVGSNVGMTPKVAQ